MSANGAVWGRVRSRLRAFPERLAACGAEAAAYGRCVQASTAPGGRLSKDFCAREFEALRSCFAAAVGQEDAGGRLLGGTLSFTPVCCHGCRALVLMAPGGTYRMPRAERKWEWRRCDVPRC
ncbi:NADH dehydrogenase [ubiquinone] 1 alpha subcomplex assembly factor 8 isoform X2 [Pan paniscus]|uniref:NADH dehydrogenase [ubiquinone] 1 alpha subcomplex assembly factor 8 isoform X2 n=1 Tax=Pan paniscus TaxID=9597 RepID=UPI00243734F6|nr:NADH dehydrogenase [ubiquinone] 1 alpha subcomplex assembly factor 8 isoform X2 [Pan paniscus]